MPNTHSLFSSSSADSVAVFAIVLVVWFTGLAMKRRWDAKSTIGVALATALVISARPTAYPTLLVPATAVIFSQLPRWGTQKRIGALISIALGLNAWWIIGNWTSLGDPLGISAYVGVAIGSEAPEIREYALWRGSAVGPVGMWSLLVNSEWLWVQQSRMLLTARTWINPVVLVVWFATIVLPISAHLALWSWQHIRRRPHDVAITTAAILASAAGLIVPLYLSQSGFFAAGKYMYMNSIPLVVILVASLASTSRPFWAWARATGLVFACTLSITYFVSVLA